MPEGFLLCRFPNQGTIIHGTVLSRGIKITYFICLGRRLQKGPFLWV